MKNSNFEPKEAPIESSLAPVTGSPIEQYVKLRRLSPEIEVETPPNGWIDNFHSKRGELEKHGFDTALYAQILDGDLKAISELCLSIMEKILAAQNLSKAGETHLARRKLAVPDALIDWLIGFMLDALYKSNNSELPADLIFLIKERLNCPKARTEDQIRTYNKKDEALIKGGRLKAMGKTPSMRAVAKLVEVAPSTVSRWFTVEEFHSKIDGNAKFWDRRGRLKGVED